ncbi:hypothetical protein FF38_10695 [Lucilia cuprina]|uniref:Venom allergen-1 n=1 Tax=Lucilia cuprina TaxID=7375 RepID=A0A0L0CII6_LUCCU|nr:hypothetical protein FF38_10695 [Lucilia cuprina]
MDRLTVLFYFMAITIALVSGTDYCSSSLCDKDVKHIACDNDGKFAESCSNDAKIVPLTDSLKQVLVDAHNAKRNFIAGGGDPNHDPACRMATMQWDDELAAIAAFNVKQCKMQHDKCRNTDAFKYSGQNLVWVSYYDYPNDAERLKQYVDIWFSEVKNSNRTIIASYPMNYKGPMIGHFTVMVADRNIRLGCAASTYAVQGQSYKAYLLACNYATTNVLGFPLYVSSKKPAECCTTGHNPKYPNLCSISEEYSKKNMNKFVIVFCFVTLASTVIATDYCSKKICDKGETHIACDNDGEFHSNCPDDAEKREITDSLKKLIVDRHNEKRNIIAGGGEKHLKAACRMATMEWDDELASLAELNVLQCKMKHDKCHNTDQFRYSGQNLASLGFTKSPNDTALIEKSIRLWYNEKSDVKQSYIDKYPKGYKGPKIGHFTVMMADRNIRVGCAAATYSASGKGKAYLFACNYASTNMVKYAIYKSCDKPAADCKSGTNTSYKNLCSTSESYKNQTVLKK